MLPPLPSLLLLLVVVVVVVVVLPTAVVAIAEVVLVVLPFSSLLHSLSLSNTSSLPQDLLVGLVSVDGVCTGWWCWVLKLEA